MKIGSVDLASPFAIAPMAGMTDTAFRRLVKRHGGCGLVVTEMVSSEGLVRGIDRTLEYAEYTEEERPISIQIFGGDPDKMAAAAQIVEGMGADIVDVNMGCPVPKIAKHNAGCSLMREPAHAAAVIGAMTKAVKIPVTVKMRAGWNDGERNAPTLARMVEDAGAAAVAVHGRTAAQSYSGSADWDLVAPDRRRADDSGVRQRRLRRARADRRAAGVGRRRRARRPRRAAQSVDSRAGGRPRRRPAPRAGDARGSRPLPARLHRSADCTSGFATKAHPQSHDRWVINKLRALGSWYTKGLEGGSHLADRDQQRAVAARTARRDRRLLPRAPAQALLLSTGERPRLLNSLEHSILCALC